MLLKITFFHLLCGVVLVFGLKVPLARIFYDAFLAEGCCIFVINAYICR